MLIYICDNVYIIIYINNIYIIDENRSFWNFVFFFLLCYGFINKTENFWSMKNTYLNI